MHGGTALLNCLSGTVHSRPQYARPCAQAWSLRVRTGCRCLADWAADFSYAKQCGLLRKLVLQRPHQHCSTSGPSGNAPVSRKSVVALSVNHFCSSTGVLAQLLNFSGSLHHTVQALNSLALHLTSKRYRVAVKSSPKHATLMCKSVSLGNCCAATEKASCLPSCV